MSKSETLAAEVKPFRVSPAERAEAAAQDLSGPENRHSEINARRSRTEDRDALRRIRSL
jgi:hypothetical protein